MNYWIVPSISQAMIRKNSLTIQKIENEVCEYFSTEKDLLHEKNRKPFFVKCRFIIFYLCCRTYNISSTVEVAAYFDQDHTSIIHGLKTLRDRMDTEPVLKQTVHEITAIISGADIIVNK